MRDVGADGLEPVRRRRGERLGARVEATAGGSLAVAFVVGSLLGIFVLAQSQPLDSLATPTPICIKEIEVVVATFLAYHGGDAARKETLWTGAGRPSSACCDFRVEPPTPIRVVARRRSSSVFSRSRSGQQRTSWAATTVSVTASIVHPILSLIYNNTVGLVPYISSLDKGTQASFYLCLATSGVIILMLTEGSGRRSRTP